MPSRPRSELVLTARSIAVPVIAPSTMLDLAGILLQDQHVLCAEKRHADRGDQARRYGAYAELRIDERGRNHLSAGLARHEQADRERGRDHYVPERDLSCRIHTPPCGESRGVSAEPEGKFIARTHISDSGRNRFAVEARLITTGVTTLLAVKDRRVRNE